MVARATIMSIVILIAYATIICNNDSMEKQLGPKQLKSWEILITAQARVLWNIEKDLSNRDGVLPLHWYDVLLVLKSAPTGKMRLNEIADKIVTSRSALTRSIDKLVSEGYIKKSKADEDGRGLYAAITEKGRAAQKYSWSFYRNSIQENFGKFLTNDEAEQLQKILEKLGSL